MFTGLVHGMRGEWITEAGPRPRLTYRLELIATYFFSLALAAIDGGVVAVFAKQTFAGVVAESRLNFAVAALGTMDALANILSFGWSQWAQARPKIPIINALQVGLLVSVASIGLLPRNAMGLYVLVGLALVARLCWSGIITIRPTVWRANYPREMRARVVARLSVAQVVTVGIVGMLLGRLLDLNRLYFSGTVILAAAMGAAGVWFTSRMRVRSQGVLLRREVGSGPRMKPWDGPAVVLRVLRTDKRYAQFMACMFVLGFGNLMVTPMLAITLREQFNLNYFWSIIIASTTQQLVVPLAIPAWARFLERSHVVRFRAIHSWTFVVAGVVFLLGAVLHRVELTWLGSAIMGVGYAGGNLAWNLGHVDFSQPSHTSLYMATHVTLNGVRGLLAPLVAVSIYEALKLAGADAPVWVFAASLMVSLSGALGFVALRASMGKGADSLASRGA